jgi:hypothetical protein
MDEIGLKFYPDVGQFLAGAPAQHTATFMSVEASVRLAERFVPRGSTVFAWVLVLQQADVSAH